jgi:pimeloyl-ACP methyl ester carboxylesterase
MATRLLIVHGYSDGSTSFTALGNYLIAQGVYPADRVHYLNYASMDDQATFHDLADKLDADHRTQFGRERVDVVCHSTGSLVVRAWLALHARRAFGRGTDDVCPVDRLICLAPANFGSDLAAMGQSFLGKFRSTFFNSNARREDFFESGKAVLQGLEPASPFQWLLSCEHDLHTPLTYFSPARPDDKRCYPFVLAAGDAYSGLQAKLIKKRGMPGTDGTVRIAGTSLNTRGCSLDFRENGPALVWWKDHKFTDIPFCVFAGFNHGTIVDPDTPGYSDDDGPGGLMRAVLTGRTTLADYATMAARFAHTSAAHQARLADGRQDPFQQFFFRVRDDIGMPVEDYFVDFHVVTRDGKPHEALTVQFDEDFATKVHVHSADQACRVFMVNCSNLRAFHAGLIAADARLMLEVTGRSALPDVRYAVHSYVAFDPTVALVDGEPMLLSPNTTTFVDVILDRLQTDSLLAITDSHAAPMPAAPAPAAPPVSGRATLLERDDAPQ